MTNLRRIQECQETVSKVSHSSIWVLNVSLPTCIYNLHATMQKEVLLFIFEQFGRVRRENKNITFYFNFGKCGVRGSVNHKMKKKLALYEHKTKIKVSNDQPSNYVYLYYMYV